MNQADLDLRALAVDYDGTIAVDGHVDVATLAALRRWKASGRKLVLVTGRRLVDITGGPGVEPMFDEMDLFDLVICENGAVAYNPHAPIAERIRPLAPVMDDATYALLNSYCRGSAPGRKPMDRGLTIGSTKRPNDIILRALIQIKHLPYAVECNREWVMTVPRGITKATGLRYAAAQLGLRPDQFVGSGDARNDLSFLDICGYSVAPAQAERVVKHRVDITMRGNAGAAISEAIERIMLGQLPRRRQAPIREVA